MTIREAVHTGTMVNHYAMVGLSYLKAKEKKTPHEIAEDIIQRVCIHFSLKREDLNRRTRKTRIRRPRQIAIYLICHKIRSRLSQTEIGSLFGGYDHTTIIHTCKTIQNLIDTEPEFAAMIDDLK